eukprot:gene8081-8946_t
MTSKSRRNTKILSTSIYDPHLITKQNTGNTEKSKWQMLGSPAPGIGRRTRQPLGIKIIKMKDGLDAVSGYFPPSEDESESEYQSESGSCAFSLVDEQQHEHADEEKIVEERLEEEDNLVDSYFDEEVFQDKQKDETTTTTAHQRKLIEESDIEESHLEDNVRPMVDGKELESLDDNENIVESNNCDQDDQGDHDHHDNQGDHDNQSDHIQVNQRRRSQRKSYKDTAVSTEPHYEVSPKHHNVTVGTNTSNGDIRCTNSAARSKFRDGRQRSKARARNHDYDDYDRNEEEAGRSLKPGPKSKHRKRTHGKYSQRMSREIHQRGNFQSVPARLKRNHAGINKETLKRKKLELVNRSERKPASARSRNTKKQSARCEMPKKHRKKSVQFRVQTPITDASDVAEREVDDAHEPPLNGIDDSEADSRDEAPTRGWRQERPVGMARKSRRSLVQAKSTPMVQTNKVNKESEVACKAPPHRITPTPGNVKRRRRSSKLNYGAKKRKSNVVVKATTDISNRRVSIPETPLNVFEDDENMAPLPLSSWKGISPYLSPPGREPNTPRRTLLAKAAVRRSVARDATLGSPQQQQPRSARSRLSEARVSLSPLRNDNADDDVIDNVSHNTLPGGSMSFDLPLPAKELDDQRQQQGSIPVSQKAAKTRKRKAKRINPTSGAAAKRKTARKQNRIDGLEIPPSKIQDILNDADNREEGPRRGNRTRVPPIKYWNLNEYIEYERRNSGLVIKDVVRSENSPVYRPKSKPATKKKRVAATTSTSSDQDEDFSDEVNPVQLVRDASDQLVAMRIFNTPQMLNLVAPGPLPDGTQVSNLLIHKFFNHRLFSVGTLVILPKSEKGLQIVENDTMLFFVQKGSVSVTIEERTTQVGKGCTFFVPCGNCYNIENLLDKKAELQFVQIKG